MCCVHPAHLQKEGAQWEGDMATKGTDATRAWGVVLGVRTIQHSLRWRWASVRAPNATDAKTKGP